VNTAVKVWKAIEDNRGSADASTTYANALPAGADPQQLTGPQGHSRISWRWDEGIVLKDFTLDVTVLWHHSARYRGGGAWIPAAYVLPELKLGWMGGYSITLTCTANDPWTSGNANAPVAQLPLTVEMHWTNWLWSNITTAQVTLGGDGSYQYFVEDTYPVEHS
jgi:hypothetical protein